MLTADLADRPTRAGLLDRVTELGLTADVLVNNAGFSTLGPVAKSDPDDEMKMVEVDVVAVVDLCSRFLPGMVQRGRGAILNVASTAAFQPLPGQAGYGAGKAFVLSYTQSLAGELRGSGVTATTLCPGPVDTGFGERAGFSKEDAENALPKVMWVDAVEVAKVAVDAMDKGRLVAIPGVANRVAAAIAQVTPRTLLLPTLAKSHPGCADYPGGVSDHRDLDDDRRRRGADRAARRAARAGRQQGPAGADRRRPGLAGRLAVLRDGHLRRRRQLRRLAQG